jgi:hypothetical protein
VSGVIARRGPALALAVTCLIAGLTGCSEGDPEPEATTPAVRVTPGIPAPALPAAAKANTPDGAVAFFKHFVAVYNYSYATNDSSAIKTVSVPTCVFCHGIEQNADLSAKLKVRTEGGAMVVDETKVAKGDAANGAIVIGEVTQGTSQSFDSAGKKIAAHSSARKLELTALARWVDNRWKMTDVQLKELGPV